MVHASILRQFLVHLSTGFCSGPSIWSYSFRLALLRFFPSCSRSFHLLLLPLVPPFQVCSCLLWLLQLPADLVPLSTCACFFCTFHLLLLSLSLVPAPSASTGFRPSAWSCSCSNLLWCGLDARSVAHAHPPQNNKHLVLAFRGWKGGDLAQRIVVMSLDLGVKEDNQVPRPADRQLGTGTQADRTSSCESRTHLL